MMFVREEGDDECTVKLEKYGVSMIILLCIAVLCMIVVVSITIKFFRTFKLQKKLFSVFLLLINLTLFARVAFLTYVVYEYAPGKCRGSFGYCPLTFLSYSGVMFLSIAGAINIYNWIDFVLKIKPSYGFNKQKVPRLQKFAFFSFVPIPIIIIILYGGGIVWGCTFPNDGSRFEQYGNVRLYMYIVAAIVFFLLAVGFIIVSRWLRSQLRLYNEDIEAALRTRLIYSTCMLTIPFMIRCTYNIVAAALQMDRKILSKSIANNTWTAPFVYFIYILLADLLPITSQLVSMLVVIEDVNEPSGKNSFLDNRSDTITEDDDSFFDYNNDEPKIQIKTSGYTSGTFNKDI